MAGMESKMGTVPKVIPVRAIHLLNPVAPSTDKKGDPTTIRRKAPLYSGTITYTPPETIPPLPGGAEFLTARDYQAGDMWSVGVVLANVLGGSGLRISMLGSHDKTIFAQAEDRVIWTKLNKLSAALKENGMVPDQWTDAMDLLRSLTRHDPQERMTAAEVLQHPFLKKAEMLPRLYSS
jgi:serine/threonine protein kinase